MTDQERIEQRLPDYFKALEMPWHLACSFLAKFVDDDEEYLGVPDAHARNLFHVARSEKSRADAEERRRMTWMEDCQKQEDRADALTKELAEAKQMALHQKDACAMDKKAIDFQRDRAEQAEKECKGLVAQLDAMSVDGWRELKARAFTAEAARDEREAQYREAAGDRDKWITAADRLETELEGTRSRARMAEDKLVEAEAEVKRLQHAHAVQVQANDQLNAMLSRSLAERDKAQAEAEKMREALKLLATDYQHEGECRDCQRQLRCGNGPCDEAGDIHIKAISALNAALSPAPEIAGVKIDPNVVKFQIERFSAPANTSGPPPHCKKCGHSLAVGMPSCACVSPAPEPKSEWACPHGMNECAECHYHRVQSKPAPKEGNP